MCISKILFKSTKANYYSINNIIGCQKPTVNHVTITVPDAIASNGVVHVIGDTLFPVPVGNVFDVLDNCTSFSKFRDYISKAGLDAELKNPSNAISEFN